MYTILHQKLESKGGTVKEGQSMRTRFTCAQHCAALLTGMLILSAPAARAQLLDDHDHRSSGIGGC